MKGVYCELDEKYINKGVPHCSVYHITIRSNTIYTDLEPCVQLSLIQQELCTQTKGSLSFFYPPLITGFWHFFGLSEKDPKQHINNGRSHMMKILLTHPQGSVVLSLRENYSGAKNKSKITYLLFLVRRSINIASTWRRSPARGPDPWSRVCTPLLDLWTCHPCCRDLIAFMLLEEDMATQVCICSEIRMYYTPCLLQISHRIRRIHHVFVQLLLTKTWVHTHKGDAWHILILSWVYSRSL